MMVLGSTEPIPLKLAIQLALKMILVSGYVRQVGNHTSFEWQKNSLNEGFLNREEVLVLYRIYRHVAERNSKMLYAEGTKGKNRRNLQPELASF